LAKITKLQMLHGCRSDLSVKCLVYSKKGRDFNLNLSFKNLNRNEG